MCDQEQWKPSFVAFIECGKQPSFKDGYKPKILSNKAKS